MLIQAGARVSFPRCAGGGGRWAAPPAQARTPRHPFLEGEEPERPKAGRSNLELPGLLIIFIIEIIIERGRDPRMRRRGPETQLFLLNRLFLK